MFFLVLVFLKAVPFEFAGLCRVVTPFPFAGFRPFAGSLPFARPCFAGFHAMSSLCFAALPALRGSLAFASFRYFVGSLPVAGFLPSRAL